MDASVRSFSATKFCERWPPGNSRSRARCAWCRDRSRCASPPITPASAIGPSASAITRFDGLKLVALVVQRVDLLAGARAAHENRRPVQLVGVERVHGLRQLRQHVVRDVHDVVDRIQSDRFQPVLQPERRRLHGHVLENQRAVSRAQREVFDLDADRGFALRQQIELHRIAQLASVRDRGHLARHAVMSPQVRPVRERFVVDLDHQCPAARQRLRSPAPRCRA